MARRPRNGAILICVVCGNEYYVPKYRVNTSKCCSKKCLHVYIGRCVKGERHPCWKGGITERGNKVKQWRKQVITRDGTCVRCSGKIDLTAHHIKSWKEYPGLRYDVKNGETLCSNCHAGEHPDYSADFIRHTSRRSIIRCAHCGKEFLSRRRTSKYCSVECRWLSRRKRVSIVCLHCGKVVEVISSRSNAKYCSWKCAVADGGFHRKFDKENVIYSNIGGNYYGRKMDSESNKEASLGAVTEQSVTEHWVNSGKPTLVNS